jgi:dolichol-phosphate mannosyltransferase
VSRRGTTAEPARPGGAQVRPRPRVSVIVPVYNEADAVLGPLRRLLAEIHLPAEVLIVHDTPDDTTVPFVAKLAADDPRVRAVLNTHGPGPANAIRYGIDTAAAPVAVVTMADGCDDPRQIDELTRLVERGVVVACASRYMPGGQQVGGPRLKRLLSRWAGRSLHLLARAGTRDATNSFKAYDTGFIQAVGIESRTGFEIGLELVAKATRARLPVAEIPTIWLDRQLGESHFDLGRFLPSYLRWYLHCYGRRQRLTLPNRHQPTPHPHPHPETDPETDPDPVPDPETVRQT